MMAKGAGVLVDGIHAVLVGWGNVNVASPLNRFRK